MCSDCNEIEIQIARYQRLGYHINDRQARDAAERLIAELEAKKMAMHPDEVATPSTTSLTGLGAHR